MADFPPLITCLLFNVSSISCNMLFCLADLRLMAAMVIGWLSAFKAFQLFIHFDCLTSQQIQMHFRPRFWELDVDASGDLLKWVGPIWGKTVEPWRQGHSMPHSCPVVGKVYDWEQLVCPIAVRQSTCYNTAPPQQERFSLVLTCCKNKSRITLRGTMWVQSISA